MIPVWRVSWVFLLVNWIADFIELFWKIEDRNWNGFATPLGVIVHSDLTDSALVDKIKHENKHVEQWWRYWVVGFLPVYLYQICRYGYYDAPLEVEAREAALRN